jgi:hypothetical protein
MAKRKAAPNEGPSQNEAPGAAPADSVYIGKSVKPEFIYLRLANRHGRVRNRVQNRVATAFGPHLANKSSVRACRSPRESSRTR